MLLEQVQQGFAENPAGAGHYPAPQRMNPQAEMQHMQQQLQHLCSLPPNPQTQQQIGELHERIAVLQRQAWPPQMAMAQQFVPAQAPAPYINPVRRNQF